MEIAASIIGSILVKTGRFLYDSIYPTIHDAIKIQSMMAALEKEIKNLVDLREDITGQLALAEREEKLPTPQVQNWLKEVEKLTREVDIMKEGMEANKKRLGGCFCSCSLRYRLSKEVAKLLKKVKRLVVDGSFPNGLLTDNYAAKCVEPVPGPSIQDQTTASKNLAKLMELLDDDGVRRIGIWGMGGVGKTTLVKNLNNCLVKNSSRQPLRTVILTTVSKVSDLKRVQAQIAERLNLVVKMEESEQQLSIRLYKRLLKEKNFLLILDDVWETIDLDCLGIPRPEDHASSKIMLTSRNLDVCRAMKTDVEVRVDVLDDEESWKLFSQNAGEVACLDYIKPFAEAICKECKGLPLAIITMGTAMRGKTMIKLWKHAMKELRKSEPCIKGIEDHIYKPVKWSYDSLEGKNIKSCFLYCSLFPEDFSIEVHELVWCWLAEGLLEEQENYEDSINRGIALIENLKDNCLLENGHSKGTVKMHDVVRDVAIWIASSLEDTYKSHIRSGAGLSEISEIELLNSLRRVSFMNNKITRLPDSDIQCSETLSLLLQGNFPLDRVPHRFLQGFPSLRLLNLSGTRIQSLPLSLLQLHDLRSLLLRDCYYLESLPPLGGLSKLQVLDICATSIRELPEGMENLSNMRQLNLSRTHYLKTIHYGIISSLTSLEVLDMTLSNYHWGLKGEVEEGETNFEELGCL